MIWFVLFVVHIHVDLTITTEKLVELFGTVHEQQVDIAGLWLFLPRPKIKEVKAIYQSPTQRRDAYLDLYVSDHPYPSWKTVAGVLREVGLHHQADEVERTYVQGTNITCTNCRVRYSICVYSYNVCNILLCDAL